MTLAACSDDSQPAATGSGGSVASGGSSAGGSGGKGGASGGNGGASSATGGSTTVSSGGAAGAGTGGATSAGGQTGQDAGAGGTKRDGGNADVGSLPDAEAKADTESVREAGTGRDLGFARETTGEAGVAGAGGGPGTGGAGGAGGAGGSAGYCPDGEACRISPLGDSITEGMGWNYPSGGGYRSKLFSLILKDSKKVTFVGTRSNGPDTVDGVKFPKNHEGTSGITIQDLQKNVVDKGALTGASVKPHIILLHIGTNNLSGGSASQNANLLGSLLDSIIKNCPDALLVVAKIIPFNGNESGYNAAIPAVVEERVKKGAHIIIVDQSAGFDGKKDIGDGVHPNEGGYTKMAAVWYKAISEYLK